MGNPFKKPKVEIPAPPPPAAAAPLPAQEAVVGSAVAQPISTIADIFTSARKSTRRMTASASRTGGSILGV